MQRATLPIEIKRNSQTEFEPLLDSRGRGIAQNSPQNSSANGPPWRDSIHPDWQALAFPQLRVERLGARYNRPQLSMPPQL